MDTLVVAVMVELLVQDDIFAEGALKDPGYLGAVGDLARGGVRSFDKAETGCPIPRMGP